MKSGHCPSAFEKKPLTVNSWPSVEKVQKEKRGKKSAQRGTYIEGFVFGPAEDFVGALDLAVSGIVALVDTVEA